MGDNPPIMPMPQTRSARILMAALLLTLAGVTAALYIALHQPWLGLTLSSRVDAYSPGIEVLQVAGNGPAAAIAKGSRLLSISASGQRVALQPSDLIEEPDYFDTYAEVERFFQRQTQIAALQARPLLLSWQDPAGQVFEQTVAPLPSRPLASLPLVFWFQLLCGGVALLVGAWVYALKPKSWPGRLLALSGLLFLPNTYSAAIYSTRELALPGGLFELLSAVNHLGALGFGGALATLFLVYPARLAAAKWLWPVPIIVVGWWAMDAARLAPNVSWGVRIPLLLEILLAVALAVVQWRRSAIRAADRAALRWFMLSAMLGAFTFVVFTFGSRMIGVFTPMQQGYAFGFFLAMYLGLALGVGRYHLFDLDRWAYRLLLWVLGLGLIIVLDMLLVLLLNWRHDMSLILTLLLAGLLYLPMRQWLWGRMMQGELPPIDKLLPEIISVAFTAQTLERERRWLGLLDRLYQPLHNLPMQRSEADTGPGLAQDGLELRIAPAGGLAARRLQGRSAGQRLFTVTDADLATSLVTLFNQAAAGRDALETGVQQERDRIASDLHDDIGAKLLTLRHLVHGEREQAMLMTTIDQLRAIVRGLRQAVQPWEEFAADIRSETAQRLAAAGMALDWPPPLIGGLNAARLPPQDAAQQYHLRALLQEAVSNAIRHARASRVSVRLSIVDTTRMRLDVFDDGIGIDPQHATTGHGLTSMQIRARALGGQIAWRRNIDRVPSSAPSGKPAESTAPPSGHGTWVELVFPLGPVHPI
ncbi:putative Signal transduction histidine kinase [Thiomonas sp. CB2]|nr:putative Signal transduction histidine kinase [Thiomonas sp. CB2]VDY04726.1 putative Signal transduction histidine kinase [Thiomonas sp. Bio17B3]VDY08102.1 putative Signal transduction histidine kinase [Thiomonas sp. Sup16B3]VDY17816.1 putative Signal transduction histidine kinase [Thiomonas sp. CB2]